MNYKVILGVSIVAAICAGQAIAKDANFNKSATDFVKEITIGVNIGNTLDVPSGNETDWGCEKITPELIKAYKAKGFTAIRLPISWRAQFDREDPTHTIKPAFLARIKEIVDFCIAEDLVTIINIHHDGGDDGWPGAWLTIDGTHVDQANGILADIWKQIATQFKDYDSRLVFEGFNEVRKAKKYAGTNGKQAGQEDWAGNAEYCGVVNRYAKTFYDTVRATGGNNAKRYLIVPTYGAAYQEVTCKLFENPNPADNHIIVSIHCYEPGDFCIWGNRKAYDAAHTQKILSTHFNNFKTYFTDKGLPVILGEINADLRFYDAEKFCPNDDARVRWASHYVKLAKSYGFPCFVWESGGKTGMGLLDRKTYQWSHAEVADAFVKTANGSMTDALLESMASSVKVDVKKIYEKTDALLVWKIDDESYRGCWGQTMGYGNLNGNGANLKYFSSDAEGNLIVKTGAQGGNMVHQQFWGDQSVTAVRTYKAYVTTHDKLDLAGRKLCFTVTALEGTAALVKGFFKIPGLKDNLEFGADVGKEGCVLATKENPVVKVELPLPEGVLPPTSKSGISAELHFIPGQWGANLPLNMKLSKIEIK